ncbi:hypothetical protein AYO22_11397 [Fonsecaea multimorphosa]|nr:hypothetical protein AYO22_11397 [Fonsecaea multimorphosa]
MTADNTETQSQDNHIYSVPTDARDRRPDHAGGQQPVNGGQRPWSLESIPDIESLRITELSKDAFPTTYQKPIDSDVPDSTPSTLLLARDSPCSFDAVFNSLSADDGLSDFSNNVRTDQCYERALVAGVRLAQDTMALCDTIKEHNTDDSKTVDALRKDLKQLCTFKPTREKIVGLLGRSGEGRSDTNTARIKAGQMYLTTCDCVFILSNISRAVTDDSLKSSVYELLAQEMPLEWEMNRGERLQVIVICTKTDVSTQERVLPLFTNRLKEINIPANKRAFIPDNSPEFRSCIQELEKEKKQTDDEKKKKSLQTQIKSLLIKARNNNVRSKLRRSYQLENPNSQLNVFCVSSKMYNKSVNKDGADRMLELSGIPLLRLFCRSLNRLDRREEISNFIRSDLRGLLNTVDLLSSTIISQMDGETAAEVWKDAQEKIDYIIISAEDETKEQCLKTLADYFERRTTIWKQAALQQFQKWLSWHWTQFDAFCLHYGDYETKKIKRTNWNRDIIWRMAQELAYPLTEIEEDASGAFDKLLSHVQQEEDDLKETYKEGGLPPALLFGVELHVQSLAFEVRKAQKNLKRELVILCRSFLEANRASYVVQKMMPAYLSASSEFGSGMMRRQQNMMRSQITDELFPAMQTAMEDSLSGLFESTFGDLRNKLQHILHLVRNSVAIGLASSSALQQVRTDTDSFRSGVQQLRAEYEHIADQIGAAQ